MEQVQPLVTIGIPTYNRADRLKRAIESTLAQDHKNIEVIVSDDASTDDTQNICQLYCKQDSRFRYIRQVTNLGQTANFNALLRVASGEFFLWLSDDDWLDAAYVSRCVQQLISERDMAVVGGVPQYYRKGQRVYAGKVFDLPYESWWRRLIEHYWKVTDNGLLYGVMRTRDTRELEMVNTLGGDWLWVASIVSIGKGKVLSDISIHRDEGGTSVSRANIVKVIRAPRIQAIFPGTSMAVSASTDILSNKGAYGAHSMLARIVLAAIVFVLMMLKALRSWVWDIQLTWARIRRPTAK